MLTQAEKQAIEDILVDYKDTLARHILKKRMKTECKMIVTTQDHKAVCSLGQPMPLHLKEYLFVDLALMYEDRIIT